MIFGADWSFVQNPKAASSSLTHALLPFCEPQHPRDFPDGKPSKHDIPHPGAVPLKRHRLGVVRNPYDRMVSAWSYCRDRTHPGVPFRDFVMHDTWMIGKKPRLIDFLRTPQMAWLVGCNRVLRFEDLDNEFDRWSYEVLGQSVRIPRTNASTRSGGWSAYYIADGGGLDMELIETVRRRFHVDFEVWGYGF